ncbi:MarR family winged helix-turn-helix transcriptional regulator [Kitasatospora sp. NPDC091207]|uniref:MarR family winged helix-turn-helix transcriptional regulator n=1 Tax=Kitasatospora sp. NPDC091207 TaxID=3364083 RepID=UPI003828DAE2
MPSSPPVPDPAAVPAEALAAPGTPTAPEARTGAPVGPGAPAELPAPVEPPAPAIERARRLTDVVTRLRRALRSSIRTDYPWESLPMAQVELLQTLAAAPLRVGELAARQRLAPNTVSGLVGKLLDAGFVDRQADPGDRRTARIALTPAGLRQLDDWQHAHERRIATALGTLTAADREAVMQALPALDRLARALASPDQQHRPE